MGKVQHMLSAKGPLTLSITSGKGGVGKTSLTVNLAYAIAGHEKSVLIVDGDLGLANIDVLLGLQVQQTIRDILEGGRDPQAAVVEVAPGVAVLPASSGVPDMVTLGLDEQARLGEVIHSIMDHYDYVLVDTAAGIGPSVLWFNNLTEYSLVVTGPDPASLTDAYALIKVLQHEYGREEFHVVVNFVTSEQEALQVFETLAGVTYRFLGLRPVYVGSVPRDNAVIKAARQQSPFIRKFPREKASRAIVNIAARIMRWNGRNRN